MRRRIRAFFFVFLLIVTLGSVTVCAAEESADGRNVYDDAGLLTQSEQKAVEEQILALKEASGWNIFAVTTSDTGGKSTMAFADDFFDEHSPEQEDGVAVVIDMDNRQIYISTCGIAIRYLTDERIERILDDAYEEITDGEYKACLSVMLDGVERYYEDGIPNGQYNYDTETGKVSRYRSITFVEFLIALALGILCSVIVWLSVVGKYRLKSPTFHYDFRGNGHLDLRVREDRFINQTLTHRRIPRETSGGGHSSAGRSSTHTSSSGRSHGGGGRSF
ncbi:MAG: TPM domain-containing protein [Roseburia sp.]|jgi:uncharacterized protein|nr:TPM domain-containing protein [Roseburia sp.]